MVGTFINVPNYILKCCIYVAGLLGTGHSMFGAGHVLPDYGLKEGLCYIIVCYICVHSVCFEGGGVVVLPTSRGRGVPSPSY